MEGKTKISFEERLLQETGLYFKTHNEGIKNEILHSQDESIFEQNAQYGNKSDIKIFTKQMAKNKVNKKLEMTTIRPPAPPQKSIKSKAKSRLVSQQPQA